MCDKVAYKGISCQIWHLNYYPVISGAGKIAPPEAR